VGAIGILVDEMGQHLFASAAFAQQQHGEIEARHLHGMSAQLTHLLGGGKEIHALADFDGLACAGTTGLSVLQTEAQHLVHLFLLHGLER